MKKPVPLLFCLLLAACGSFQVDVEIRPLPTATPPPTPTFTPTRAPTASLTVTSGSAPAATDLVPTLTSLPVLRGGLPVSLTAIHMFSATSGWGIEAAGHVLRTNDGGLTWRDVTPPQGKYTDGGFYALDAATAWAAPNVLLQTGNSQAPLPTSTTVWRTDDGGLSWQPSQPIDESSLPPVEYSSPVAMQFINPQTGWLLVGVSNSPAQVSQELFRTTDSGISWQLLLANATFCSGVGFAFVEAETGWVGDNCLSQGNAVLVPVSRIAAKWASALIQVPDRLPGAGNPLKFTSLPMPAQLPAEFSRPEYAQVDSDCGVTRIAAIAPKKVGLEWTCKLYTTPPQWYRFYYITPDGGQTWRSWQATGSESFLSAEIGWRLYSPGPGQSNQLQRTVDGGLTWSPVKTVTWQEAHLDFVNEQTGWAIATGETVAALVHTSDGGKTWEQIQPMTADPYPTPTPSTVFDVDYFRLIRTSDPEKGPA